MNKIIPTLIGGIDNRLSETTKNVIVYVDQYGINLNNYKHNEYDYKIYWQIEGNGVIRRRENNISFPIINKHNFDLILASDPEILKNCENSILFPFGDCWIPKDEQKIHEKTKLLSIIASAKRDLPGHQLRHSVMATIGDKMDIYGRCCNYIENKSDALRDYKFNICIENLQHPNWFTEKLNDCLRTGTVPIYWGCPNISDFFNTKGFIIVNSQEDIINVVNNLTDDDYISRLEYINENFNRSLKYGNNLFERVDNEIKKLINE
jgi:hypothetical protein